MLEYFLLQLNCVHIGKRFMQSQTILSVVLALWLYYSKIIDIHMKYSSKSEIKLGGPCSESILIENAFQNAIKQKLHFYAVSQSFCVFLN